MKVYGQLIRAQLENKTSNYSAGVKGMIWHNTTDVKTYVDNGTVVRALLINDDKAILGNHGTASSNIRFHRGAASVLQFVTGDDATAEGTLSTSLAQISFKAENYATASLPAAGNAGRIAYDSTLGYLKWDNGVSWQALSLAAVNQYDAVCASTPITNLSTHTTLTAAVAAVSAGDEVLVMNQTFSENPDISKQLSVYGQGYSSVISGNLTISGNNCCVEKLRVTGSLIITGTGNIIDKIWMPQASVNTFLGSQIPDGNYIGTIMPY